MTTAEADLLGSAALVAVIVQFPATEGAVYRPPLVTVPPEAVQVTAVLVAPLTVAVNWVCCPVCKEALAGDTDTDTLPVVPPEPVDPEPNAETMQVENCELVDQVVGNEVNVVWRLVSE